MKALPRKLFVVWDQQPNDKEAYLIASETWGDHAEMSRKKEVGVYQLVDMVTVSAEPTIAPKKRKR